MTPAGLLPTVSVVIPCFNQARYLRHAISSALSQSHAPLECIVVDDGSTDETAEVAEVLHARVIKQANRGVSAARNAGLAAARGELIVFLDADDELLPNALEREAGALAGMPDIVAVVTRCEAMDEAGTPLAVAHHTIDPDNLYRDWLSSNFVWTPGAAMFRRAPLAEIGGFAHDLGPAADYALYLRLARDHRIGFIEGSVVRYRQHGASMSRDPALMLRATLEAVRREEREGPVWARGDARRARRAWCAWYGEQVVDDLRVRWRDGSFGMPQLLAILTLVRRCPSVVVQHVTRKARRTVAAVLKAPSAAGKAPR
jgi:glycosyltransferase involved in cell wall biosynthesis